MCGCRGRVGRLYLCSCGQIRRDQKFGDSDSLWFIYVGHIDTLYDRKLEVPFLVTIH